MAKKASYQCPTHPATLLFLNFWQLLISSSFRELFARAARGTKLIMQDLEMQILEALSPEDWTETLQVAKAVGKNSKSHWALDCPWLWFQKQMARFWTPKCWLWRICPNSCIWIILHQEICSPGEVNPTLYKLESAGKVLKDSTSKPRWKAVLPNSDSAFHDVFLGVKILMPWMRDIWADCL